ncbi:MAG TPA: tetratricopeptide repeat protein, partial [Isosphaeraceae bacterium]|nr:tetratricopeptide repeat protein [Isosphaeraceae bacterium]
MGLISQALQKGIPDEADRAYARGMLAKNVPDAIDHFRHAIEIKPFHHRANGMLGWLLTLTGDIPEAREQIAVAAILFPEDPTFKMMKAWVTAAEGDLPRANKLLDQLGPLLS